MAEEDVDRKNLLALTTDIVAAHVAHNTVTVADLPILIRQVHASLASLGSASEENPARPTPAVAIKRSITPDLPTCLEDRKKFKMLKRHLKTTFNLTPQQYRERWGLPSDYPMVAPNYSAERSQMAKDIGLGTRKRAKGK
ncbi:MAG: MucR family transcriptional regulator [Proteobacteria bacterium]|nr:MucR family transcriptional regulator [Pseudomonadota bacterium]MBI3495886.1 MucR family transcriptional regulator [Pseudomonadota bacterium]